MYISKRIQMQSNSVAEALRICKENNVDPVRARIDKETKRVNAATQVRFFVEMPDDAAMSKMGGLE